jgi:hypothetical protein
MMDDVRGTVDGIIGGYRDGGLMRGGFDGEGPRCSGMIAPCNIL